MNHPFATPPAPELIWCKYCHGTGTIFTGKTLGKGSKVCPVCKGKCKVPQ